MKIKNLKINKKIASLVLAGSIALTSIGISMTKNNGFLLPNKMANGESVSFYQDETMYNGKSEIIPESQITNVYGYNEDWDLVVYKGSIGFVAHKDIDDIAHDETAIIKEAAGTATITATIGLRFRLGPTTDYKKKSVIPYNTKVEVLGITSNNWYVVKYNNTIGYVSGDYVKYEPAPVKEKPEPIITTAYLDNPNAIYAKTNANVNFRVAPSTLDTVIVTIPRGTTVEFLDSTDNNWYKIKYNNQTGYIYGKYLDYDAPIKLRDNYTSVVYANEETGLKQTPTTSSDSLYTISMYETCQVINEEGEWLHVNCAGIDGYIPKKYTTNLTGTFVIVDISDQKLKFYKNDELVLETDIVTGKKNVNDTPTGLFSIQSKRKDTYLKGPTWYCHVDYWMPFYNGCGLHDADWRSTFGGTYYETSGSHGCVNIPDEHAKTIYENTVVGDKVLVHK